MTPIAILIAALLAAGALLTGGAFGWDTDTPAGPATALVIDAAAARDGRELVDARLRDLDAEVRLPRTLPEARTNVRYFAALGYRVVVAGPRARAAAGAAGAVAMRAPDLPAALGAVER
jgi:hypothetical protein